MCFLLTCPLLDLSYSLFPRSLQLSAKKFYLTNDMKRENNSKTVEVSDEIKA